MKKKARPESFIKQPLYPGGKKALDEFVRTNMRYPEEALKNKVEGSVKIKFDTDVFGNVTTTKLVHGIGHGCDEEAIRLVKLLKYEKKKYQGLRVTFHRTIDIHFRLQHTGAQPTTPQSEVRVTYNNEPAQEPGTTPPPAPVAPQPLTITYTVVPAKKK